MPKEKKGNCKNRGKKQKKRRINRIIWRILIFLLFVLEIFFEANPSYNYKLKLLIPNLLLFVVTTIWSWIKDKNNPTPDHTNDGIWVRAGKQIKNYIEFLKMKPLVTSLFVILLGVLCVSFLAHVKIVGRGAGWMVGIASDIIHNAEAEEPEEEIVDTDLPSEEEQPENDSPIGEDSKGNYNPEEYVAPEKITVALSKKEKAKLYFLSGEHAITDWGDPEHIRSQVREFIADKIAVKRDEETITMEYSSNAKEAKKKEKELGERGDLQERMSIIEFRKNAWYEAETYTISKLIAKDYHEAALLVEEGLWNQKIRNQYEYYEYQSIQWRLTSLEFAGADIDWIIHQLHTRYLDLTNLEIEERYSKKLKDAFKELCKYENCGTR